MTALILYATVEGQTGKIARFIKTEILDAGHTVVLMDADSPTLDFSFGDIDHVILAAPVHERRHPKTFEAFIAASHDDLSSCKTMLLSISLSAAFPEFLQEANDYVTEMKMRTGFAPNVETLVAGAVHRSSYGYYETQVLQHVVLYGKDYDPVDPDHEFTDWAALQTTIHDFLAT